MESVLAVRSNKVQDGKVGKVFRNRVHAFPNQLRGLFVEAYLTKWFRRATANEPHAEGIAGVCVPIAYKMK